MFKPPTTRILVSAPPLLAGWLAICALLIPAKTWAITSGTNTVAIQRPDDPSVLDSKRMFALGMIETGNNDRAIGGMGEISRYQLAPTVWKSYSHSREYRNPGVAIQVAQQHWSYLAAYFKQHTGRAAGDFDMYVLWNTRYGYYEHYGFSRHRLSPVVRERAQRYVNLVYRRE